MLESSCTHFYGEGNGKGECVIMLRQVFIVREEEIIYQRDFANGLQPSDIEGVLLKIKRDAKRKLGSSVGFFDYYAYKLSYDVDLSSDITFIYVTGLADDFFGRIKTQMENFKQEFLTQHDGDVGRGEIDGQALDVIIDSMHENLKPKISIVGWSGVGKTTIKNLIKMDEIPMEHVPTINCNIATIKIGKLKFRLFDFAGQDEFSYLWKGFIKGSDAVLIVTDSTEKNVEKSKYFLKLQQEEAPNAYTAVIANKQDLKGAMSAQEVQQVLKMKAYPMVANDPDNRANMINILAQVLDMDTLNNPLLGNAIEERKATRHEKITIDKPSFGSVDSLMSAFGGAPSTSDEPNLGEDQARRAAKQFLKDQAFGIEEILNLKVADKGAEITCVPKSLSEEMMKSLTSVDVHERLKRHYDMIKASISSIAGNKVFSYENFYSCFEEYVARGTFICKVPSLKQFLESQFMLLETHVDKEEMKAIKESKNTESINGLINAMLCAFLTKLDPEKYPHFDCFLDDLSSSLEGQEITWIRGHYRRILNRLDS